MPPALRSPLFLVLGLIVGGVGATLFHQSVPPPAGTEAARVADLETQLTRAQNRLTVLEGAPRQSKLSASQQSAELRSMLDEFKAGRPVDVDRLFRTLKPGLAAVAPVFDNIRRRDERKAAEHQLAELTRKYNLDASQQAAVKKWLEERSAARTERFRDIMFRDNAGLEDLIRASRDMNPHEGAEQVLNQTLTGDTLKKFQQDWMNERVTRVQNEADSKVRRLNDAVGLDQEQQDRIFALMARSSPDFDPSMRLEGLGSDSTALIPGGSRDQAIMDVLRPEQREKFDAGRREQRARAEQEMNEIGLKLPPNWNFFDD